MCKRDVNTPRWLLRNVFVQLRLEWSVKPLLFCFVFFFYNVNFQRMKTAELLFLFCFISIGTGTDNAR